MLRVAPLEQSHVKRQLGALGQALEEPGDDVRVQPGDPCVGEIDVRDEQGPAGRLEDDVREGLVRRNHRGAVPAAGAKRLRERAAERPTGGGGLEDRCTGGDLQLDVEAAVDREQSEQVVEDGKAGSHRGRAVSVHDDADAALRLTFALDRRHRAEAIAAPALGLTPSRGGIASGCGIRCDAMASPLRLAVLGWAASLVLLVAPVASAATSGRGPAIRGTITVGYSSDAALDAGVSRAGGRVLRRLPRIRVAEIAGSDRVAELLAASPGISFLERPATRTRAAEPGLAQANLLGAFEWQYAATHADTVPEGVLRAASTITIAVIDTGADLTAPDLAAKLPFAFDIRTRASDVADVVGHGTFVASLAAGSSTNGEGIAGFSGDSNLLVVRATSGRRALTDVDEAAAIIYAVDHGARVINLSFGGPSTSTTERRAIDYAAEHGALLIAAIGNDYRRGNPVHYPAALLQPVRSRGHGGRGLSVGASTQNGTRAAFSNTGTHLSLVAPGERVLGAVSVLSSSRDFPRVALPGSREGLYGFGTAPRMRLRRSRARRRSCGRRTRRSAPPTSPTTSRERRRVRAAGTGALATASSTSARRSRSRSRSRLAKDV